MERHICSAQPISWLQRLGCVHTPSPVHHQPSHPLSCTHLTALINLFGIDHRLRPNNTHHSLETSLLAVTCINGRGNKPSGRGEAQPWRTGPALEARGPGPFRRTVSLSRVPIPVHLLSRVVQALVPVLTVVWAFSRAGHTQAPTTRARCECLWFVGFMSCARASTAAQPSTEAAKMLSVGLQSVRMV